MTPHRRLGFGWIKVAALATGLIFATCSEAQTSHEPSSKSLKTFLRTQLGPSYPSFEKEVPTQYSYAFVDLNDDGTREVIVYVTGRAWCGSGGCQMLILTPERGSYRVVTETTVTRLPIRVLTKKSNGGHDITISVAGGGIQLGFEAELSFDGKTYPSNPSVPPARPLDVAGKAEGKTVLDFNSKEKLLYK